jgi:beta-barrel assembly-enhancing protease
VIAGATSVLWLALATITPAFSLISIAEEQRIGKATAAAMRRTTPVVADAQVRGYVSQVGRRLAVHAGGPQYDYRFEVADYRDLNAVALPAGSIWINRGTLESSRTESEVAGVLAHEIAHVALRHTARQISNAMLAQTSLNLFSALLGNWAGAITGTNAAAAMTSGMFFAFSRDDEREADRRGVEIARRAGWDPRGLMEFLQLVRTRAKRTPSVVEVFFSTHPATEDRIAVLEELTRRLPRGVKTSSQFASSKRRLAQLPAAKPMPRNRPSRPSR